MLVHTVQPSSRQTSKFRGQEKHNAYVSLLDPNSALALTFCSFWLPQWGGVYVLGSEHMPMQNDSIQARGQAGGRAGFETMGQGIFKAGGKVGGGAMRQAGGNVEGRGLGQGLGGGQGHDRQAAEGTAEQSGQGSEQWTPAGPTLLSGSAMHRAAEVWTTQVCYVLLV